MGKMFRITASAAGAAAALAAAGGFFISSQAAGGKRQSLEEAMKWQQEHYDTSFYDPLEKTDYTISSFDGYTIHVQLCKAPAPTDRYVIITHGYTDNHIGMLKYMPMYLDAGFNCILPDLRGHGQNEPAPCTFTALEARDLDCLIKDTRERYENISILGLHGESLGAASTIGVLRYTRDVDFAVADCAFADIENVLTGTIKVKALSPVLARSASLASKMHYGYSFDQMRPIDALEGSHVPVLYIHGEKDTFITPDNSRRMYEASPAGSEIHFIPDAGHAQSVLCHPDLYREYLNAFLRKIPGYSVSP